MKRIIFKTTIIAVYVLPCHEWFKQAKNRFISFYDPRIDYRTSTMSSIMPVSRINRASLRFILILFPIHNQSADGGEKIQISGDTVGE